MSNYGPVTLSATGNSSLIALPPVNPGTLGLQVSVTGTGTYEVQATMAPITKPPASADWVNHPTLVNLTASALANVNVPLTAVRLVCTSYTSGSASLYVCQSTPLS